MFDKFLPLYFAASEKLDPGSIGVPRVTNADGVVNGIVNAAYFWAGIVCVIVIIVGGYLYVTSNGDAAQVKRGKNAVLGAIVGIIVILSAFTITQYVIGRF